MSKLLRVGLAIGFGALAIATASNQASAALLSYNLSSELVKANCSGDTDGDCLDNAMENALAAAAAPWYYHDEDESCAYKPWDTNDAYDLLHFKRQDYFQVRPKYNAVAEWPIDGKTHWVQITYFFNFPNDCQDYVPVINDAGHQGDNEKVEVHFYSNDNKRWYLHRARYYHHHDPYHDFTGSYLATIAGQLGTTRISVGGDEDGHGSWPGRTASSEDCAGDEDHFYNDCFRGGSLRGAYTNTSNRVLVSTSRNIGGPPTNGGETWNRSFLAGSGSVAYVSMDTGHGYNREYWWGAPSSNYNSFCGFKCPEGSRSYTSEWCYAGAHWDEKCAPSLSTKVDQSAFTLYAQCGNSSCEASESCSSCPGDCGSCAPVATCGDGVCEPYSESCEESGAFPDECQQDCGCCPGWTPMCFPAGTSITMADGTSRPIEAVATGDVVAAFDESTGALVPRAVARTFVHDDAQRGLLRINGSLTATGNHPFYVNGSWKRADELDLGDQLMTLPSVTPGLEGLMTMAVAPLAVVSLETLAPISTVYNLEVEDVHTYFAEGVLVHNKTNSAGCEPSGGFEF